MKPWNLSASRCPDRECLKPWNQETWRHLAVQRWKDKPWNQETKKPVDILLSRGERKDKLWNHEASGFVFLGTLTEKCINRNTDFAKNSVNWIIYCRKQRYSSMWSGVLELPKVDFSSTCNLGNYAQRFRELYEKYVKNINLGFFWHQAANFDIARYNWMFSSRSTLKKRRGRAMWYQGEAWANKLHKLEDEVAKKGYLCCAAHERLSRCGLLSN